MEPARRAERGRAAMPVRPRAAIGAQLQRADRPPRQGARRGAGHAARLFQEADAQEPQGRAEHLRSIYHAHLQQLLDAARATRLLPGRRQHRAHRARHPEGRPRAGRDRAHARVPQQPDPGRRQALQLLDPRSSSRCPTWSIRPATSATARCAPTRRRSATVRGRSADPGSPLPLLAPSVSRAVLLSHGRRAVLRQARHKTETWKEQTASERQAELALHRDRRGALRRIAERRQGEAEEAHRRRRRAQRVEQRGADVEERLARAHRR